MSLRWPVSIKIPIGMAQNTAKRKKTKPSSTQKIDIRPDFDLSSQKLKYFETDIILVLIFFGKRSIICIMKTLEQ